jgi:hypothetical protein
MAKKHKHDLTDAELIQAYRGNFLSQNQTLHNVYELWFFDALFDSHMRVSIHASFVGADEAKKKHWDETLKKHQDDGYDIKDFDTRYRFDIIKTKVLP